MPIGKMAAKIAREAAKRAKKAGKPTKKALKELWREKGDIAAMGVLATPGVGGTGFMIGAGAKIASDNRKKRKNLQDAAKRAKYAGRKTLRPSSRGGRAPGGVRSAIRKAEKRLRRKR